MPFLIYLYIKWIGLLVILIFYNLSLRVTCQLQTEQKIVNTDSLKSKTLRELAIEFWKKKDLDSIYKTNLAKVYLSKVKKNNNKMRIADGYQIFLSIYKGHIQK